jgi:Flp pilus assembly protein protease CpaA
VPKPFFPDVVFAWVYCGLLLAFVGVAAYIDTKRAKVPNWLTVSGLGFGLLLNTVRGAWQGASGSSLWLFEPGSVWTGGLDGLLLGLSGFALAFAVFFAMWILGQCGGGDAKLFGALGGWLGWQAIIPLWIASVAVLIVWALAKLIGNGLRPGRVQSSIKKMQKAQEVSRDAAKAGKKLMRITYSLPIAVATLLTCLLYFSRELQLLPTAPPMVGKETGTGTPDASSTTPSSK